MLEIDVPKQELFNEETGEYINTPAFHLQLEHSLLSIQKWESKWHKPFLGEEKTIEEIVDYIRCMTINKLSSPDLYNYLPKSVIMQISDYIKNPMTATKIYESPESGLRRPGEKITAELIYYWMISLNIPVEFQKWHINQLLTLIKLVNKKEMPQKKLSKQEAARQRSMLNAQRRAAMHSKG